MSLVFGNDAGCMPSAWQVRSAGSSRRHQGSSSLDVTCRYILTSRGMNAMYEKYKACEFGRCPRVLCNGQPCLPVGYMRCAAAKHCQNLLPKVPGHLLSALKIPGNASVQLSNCMHSSGTSSTDGKVDVPDQTAPLVATCKRPCTSSWHCRCSQCCARCLAATGLQQNHVYWSGIRLPVDSIGSASIPGSTDAWIAIDTGEC